MQVSVCSALWDNGTKYGMLVSAVHYGTKYGMQVSAVHYGTKYGMLVSAVQFGTKYGIHGGDNNLASFAHKRSSVQRSWRGVGG